MKWKDSSEMTGQEDINDEEYFDEEQFSPWTTDKGSVKTARFSKFPIVFILLGLAIITSVAALVILLMGTKDSVSHQQIKMLEERILRLEERLDKFEAIDEKVTRIWEQAKSYEKFKDRYERSEASTSLRMDHLTMSLESLQKQLSGSKQAPPAASAKTTVAPPVVSKEPQPQPQPEPTPKAPTIQYHTVEAGDTYFNISKRFDLSVDELLKLNHLSKNDVLHIGQKIIVRQGQDNK